MSAATHSAARELEVWRLLAAVPDPEIPVVSIVDLGIVRYVRRDAANRLHVGITPTYSGCPATAVIRSSARAALDAAGHGDALLEEVLAPPWSSDWVTPAGRARLAAFGIAPPGSEPVRCPRCRSAATERVSEFGSTPCKAHYRCTECAEPFDRFKCI